MPSPESYITVNDASGQPVAYLSPEADCITDCEVQADLNGQRNLTFRLPLTCAKVAEILPERRIIAGGREFLLLAPASEERSREGRKIWFKVTAPESWVELAKKYPTVTNDFEPAPDWGTVSILASDLGKGGYPAGSAGSALWRLLQGSGWTVGTVDTTGTLIEPHDLETERINLLENIQKVQELWGGYLDWDSLNRTVSLREESAWRPGSGVRIQYAKNLKGITREVDSDLITRLYPFGQDGLTIAGVNGGQLYIEDHHYSAAVYEGIYENQDIDDEAQLLAAAQRYLAEQSAPRISYSIDVADLSALEEYAHEELALGDIVRVIDPELLIDADVRVMRHTYNVFEPWKASVEVGKPTERLASMLAGARKSSEFVKKVLRPNPSTGNLLKGLVNTFATTINSANGKLVWSDDALDAIEIDGGGAPTGRRVRVSPTGIGISTNGGQTYDVAMTGAGILANRVIVSDLYALATDDGYTKLSGDGLHVYDADEQERVHVGRWLVGGIEHYGMRVFSASGTVMLDDQGILQTWQEGYPDNVDVGAPMTLVVMVPPETRSIKTALLRIRRMAFRAYETGAASGGQTTTTISASVTGQTSTTTTSPNSTTTTGPSSTSTTTGGTHGHTVLDGQTGAPLGSEFATHYHYYNVSNTSDSGAHSHGMDHTHTFNHTHQFPHSHDMSHTHTIGSHSHAIVYGIYSAPGPLPTGITIKINGFDRTSALGGPFNDDQSGINVAQYLTVGQWNTIEIGASGLGRLDCRLFMQALLGV